MNSYQTAYFGRINLDALEEGYDSEIKYKGKTVSLDLTISGSKQLDHVYLRAIEVFLDDLPNYEARLRSALKKDLKEKVKPATTSRSY